jgi:hypothetical protein
VGALGGHPCTRRVADGTVVAAVVAVLTVAVPMEHIIC